MSRWLIVIYNVLFHLTAFAHPGIGIVKDKTGTIYYTDLRNVYRITKDGRTSIAVHNVHTHELSLDTAGNLYGEHLWYNGEALDTWGHYVWCLKKDGTLERLKEGDGFLQDYGFMRDRRNNMYWAERGRHTKFKKQAPDGRITLLAEIKTGDLRWSHVDANGNFYFIDRKDLYRIAHGKAVLVTDKLRETSPAFSYLGDRHSVYGIWSDDSQNIYVAILGAQKIKKITPGGKVSTLLHVQSPWSPVSGVFDDRGNLWIMETNQTNEVRVRKVKPEELNKPATAAASMANDALPYAIIAAISACILCVIFLVIKRSLHPA